MISPQELIERITAASDANDCFVLVKEKTQTNLRWALNTLTTNGVMADREVTVIAFVETPNGMAAGSVTRTDISPDEVADVATAAKAAAVAAGPADDAAPLATDQSYGDWTASHVPTSSDVFGRIAPELGDMFRRAHDSSIELFGYAEHSSTTVWLGSKGGLRMRYDQPDGRIEMTGKSANRSRSTWEGRSTRDFSDVSIADIDAGIRQRLDWQSKRIDAPAGRYDVVMPAGAVADLFTYAVWTMSGKEAAEGQSVFSKQGGGTRLGESLSNLPVQIFSDASYAGLECAPFLTTPASGEFASVFDNGLNTPRVDFLRDGKLSALFAPRGIATAKNIPATLPVDNSIIEVTGAKDTEATLIGSTDRGLLVTCLWYIRMVDPATLLLTGLTRDGVYLIEKGEVVGAVNNFRWNDSPVDLLNRITGATGTAISQPREWADYVERVATPSMRFADFNMSTVSQAS